MKIQKTQRKSLENNTADEKVVKFLTSPLRGKNLQVRQKFQRSNLIRKIIYGLMENSVGVHTGGLPLIVHQHLE